MHWPSSPTPSPAHAGSDTYKGQGSIHFLVSAHAFLPFASTTACSRYNRLAPSDFLGINPESVAHDRRATGTLAEGRAAAGTACAPSSSSATLRRRPRRFATGCAGIQRAVTLKGLLEMTFTELLATAWKKNDSLLCVGLDPTRLTTTSEMRRTRSSRCAKLPTYDACAQAADRLLRHAPEDQLEALIAHIRKASGRAGNPLDAKRGGISAGGTCRSRPSGAGNAVTVELHGPRPDEYG